MAKENIDLVAGRKKKEEEDPKLSGKGNWQE
jgi:hypothetical protein